MSETQTVVIVADGKKLILEMACVPRYGETVNLHRSREVVTGKVVLVRSGSCEVMLRGGS